MLRCCIRRKNVNNNSVENVLRSSTSLQFSSIRGTSFEESLRITDVESLQEARKAGLQVFEKKHFKIGKKVGMGASKAHLLVRKTDNRKFVGKMLQEDRCWILINEASIMSKVSKMCANIVDVEGIIMNPKCLVLPYYENGDLGTALFRDNEEVRKGEVSKFPFLQRLRYIRDTCKAVSILHTNSICHRDLAMRNLLLSDNMEHVLLSDFTLSRVVKGTVNSQITFTREVPIFSAPETFERKHPVLQGRESDGYNYSIKSDIWGLGNTMFEIITKKKFERPHYQEYLPTRLPSSSLPPEYLFNRGMDLWFAIRRCWNIELSKRPQSWEVLRDISQLIENPIAAKTRDVYYSRYPSIQRNTSRMSLSHFDPPRRFSTTEFMTERSSKIEFSEMFSELNMKSLSELNMKSHHAYTNTERSDSISNPNFNTNMVYKCKYFSDPGVISSAYLEHFFRDNLKLTAHSINSEFSTIHHKADFPSKSTPYCKPIVTPLDSNVTNIAYCKDRHFFKPNTEDIKQAEAISTHCLGDFHQSADTDDDGSMSCGEAL